MANLIYCRVCKSAISSEALVCPKCGDPNPSDSRLKCSRCNKFVDQLMDYRGSTIGIGTIKNVCSECWEILADKDEEMFS